MDHDEVQGAQHPALGLCAHGAGDAGEREEHERKKNKKHPDYRREKIKILTRCIFLRFLGAVSGAHTDDGADMRDEEPVLAGVQDVQKAPQFF